jgi:hypothetical protein
MMESLISGDGLSHNEVGGLFQKQVIGHWAHAFERLLPPFKLQPIRAP